MITLHDLPRFRAALERMCRLHGMPTPTDATVKDWAEVLRAYDLSVIEPALDAARRDAGDYPVKATAVEEAARALTRGRLAGTDARATRYVPLYTDDAGRTLYQAEYTCPICEDGGWEPVEYDATGQRRIGVLTMGELRDREREGRVHARMRRCACKMGGAR